MVTSNQNPIAEWSLQPLIEWLFSSGCMMKDDTKSNADPSQAAITRRAFLSENCDRERLVMAAHFPEPSIGRIVRVDDAYRFVFF